MYEQAAGFAILAAISPAALLVMAVFLASANPRSTALIYVVTAMLMTVAMAVAVLLILRATGLEQPRQREPRYDLRLGLGILTLIVAAVIGRRRPPPEAMKKKKKKKKGQGLINRLTARPGPLTAVAAGIGRAHV